MRLLASIRALCATFLFLLLAPASAEPPEASGRWALHAGGRTLMILELRRDPAGPGGWRGALIRPRSIDIAGGNPIAGTYRWNNIRAPIEARPLVSARADGEALRLEFEGPPEDRDRVTFRALPRGYAEVAYNRGQAAPLRFVAARSGETVANDWDPARTYSADPEWPSNPEIATMFEADQAARRNPQGIDWAVLAPQDEARRRRARELLTAGLLQSGDDFYHAAFIFQHGSTPDDYLLAHSLAMVAVARGRADASWIGAATLDRYLQSIGRPQIFGTQYRTPPGQETTQEPYDRALVADAMRNALGVPWQAGQEERRREIQARHGAPRPPR